LIVWDEAGGRYNPQNDRWTIMSRCPLSSRIIPISLWTGRYLIVWGGEGNFDGAYYDAETDRWTLIPAWPLEKKKRSTIHSAGLWNGSVFIVWGGERHNLLTAQGCVDGATFNFENKQWTRIAGAPIPGRLNAGVTLVGRRLFVWGGASHGGSKYYSDGGLYDLGEKRWEVLPQAPVSGRRNPQIFDTHRGALIWGGETDPMEGVNEQKHQAESQDFAEYIKRIAEEHEDPLDGAFYDAAHRQWSRIPDAPLGPRTGGAVVWTGQQLIVWGGAALNYPNEPIHYNDGAVLTLR
jgi:N-acetylneuraminic acid mutarotase